jgi:heptosyltransferase-2
MSSTPLSLRNLPTGARVGVFIPNWVGDACMATPALRTLHANLPIGGQLIAIGRNVPLRTLETLPYFAQTISYKPRGRQPNMGRRSLAWSLRRNRLDLAILFTNSLSTAAMSFIGGAKRRIGYARDGRSLMLTHPIAVERDGAKEQCVPAVDYYLKIAEALNCGTDNRRMELVISADDEIRKRQFLKTANWNEDARYILINSGGAFGQSKVWPENHVATLAQRLIENTDRNVVLHCGPAERASTNAVADRLQHPRIVSMGQTAEIPMGLSRGLIGGADVVVSTDSGPRHMAVALDRQVVSIFGPTQAEWTQTYNRPEALLQVSMDCRPCYQRDCPLGHHHCMHQITVDRVLSETLIALENATQSDAAQQAA